MPSSNAARDFVEYWKTYAGNIIENGSNKDFIFAHPDDCKIIEKYWPESEKHFYKIQSWDDFLQSKFFLSIHFGKNFDDVDKDWIHLGLPPAPYAGDIENAKIILLLTNPGFSPASYYSAYQISKTDDVRFSHLIKKDIYLNPGKSWMPGYMYGIKRFRKILDALLVRMKKQGETSSEALEVFRKNIAVLQLSPYISGEVNYKIINRLPTTGKARELAQALAEDRMIIIGRSKNFWGLNESNAKSLIQLSNPRNPSFDNESVEKIVTKILSAR